MNVLFIPIYSMRSYETGKYSILKDGNFQLTMARAIASGFKDILITVPTDSSDFEEVLQRFEHLAPKIGFVQAIYGKNAVETRELFWPLNHGWICAQHELEYYNRSPTDLLISDITGYPGKIPVAYNFNITKLPELDRPYIDKFFETDLQSIERSLFTTVLNPRQREYILEVRPDLIDKIIVNTKCAHEDLLPNIRVWPANPFTIFWPFRISDKAYKWTQFVQAFEQQKLYELGYTVTITDPNDSIDLLPSWVNKIKPTKEEYYQILASQPIVVMLDEIDTVLHPGTIEFFHYGCPVITLMTNLIDNLNTIPDLRWLSRAIDDLEYNQVDMTPFVYKHNEVDSLYNEEFVNVRKS